jgi:hypothetical protein
MLQTQGAVPDHAVRPIFDSYLSNWLDHLGAYNTWEGQDIALDLIRLLYESDAYYPYMVPFPNNIVGMGNGTGPGNILNFNAGETQSGSLQIPEGSYLVSAGCYAYNLINPDAPRTGAGAKVRIYDKATQSDLFYQIFAQGHSVFSDGSITNTPDVPFGPYFLRSPYIISRPGVINWEITNLDPLNAETIQVLLSFSTPKSSINNNVVIQDEE